jgi:hypothetical protein
MHAILPQVLFAILIASSASSYKTGSDLLRDCGATQARTLPVWPTSWVWPTATRHFGRQTDRPPCAPDGLTGLQLRDVVVKHLKMNPLNRQEGGASAVISAIAAEWSCK